MDNRGPRSCSFIEVKLVKQSCIWKCKCVWYFSCSLIQGTPQHSGRQCHPSWIVVGRNVPLRTRQIDWKMIRILIWCREKRRSLRWVTFPISPWEVRLTKSSIWAEKCENISGGGVKNIYHALSSELKRYETDKCRLQVPHLSTTPPPPPPKTPFFRHQSPGK